VFDCGYPDAKLRRYDGWGTKVAGRKGMGTGRLRYVKTVARRAKNGFRAGTTPKEKARK
jgi:large subunit ribosomal protein L37e